MDFEEAGRTDTPPEDRSRGIRLTDWHTFFGADDVHHLPELLRQEDGQRPTFNWYAAIFGYYWMVFRKMYLVALAVYLSWLVVETVCALFVLALGLDDEVLLLIEVVLVVASRILYGFYADRIYFWHSERRIRSTLEQTPPIDSVIRLRLVERGGTSWASVIILFLLFAVLRMAIGKAGPLLGGIL